LRPIELKGFSDELAMYAQTQVSTLRASISISMARKSVEITAHTMHHFKENLETRMFDPIKSISNGGKLTKDNKSLQMF